MPSSTAGLYSEYLADFHLVIIMPSWLETLCVCLFPVFLIIILHFLTIAGQQNPIHSDSEEKLVSPTEHVDKEESVIDKKESKSKNKITWNSLYD